MLFEKLLTRIKLTLNYLLFLEIICPQCYGCFLITVLDPEACDNSYNWTLIVSDDKFSENHTIYFFSLSSCAELCSISTVQFFLNPMGTTWSKISWNACFHFAKFSRNWSLNWEMARSSLLYVFFWLPLSSCRKLKK